MKYFDRRLLKEALIYEPSFHDMLSKMTQEVDQFFQSFDDDPSKISHWGHHYFCKDDGGLLQFDLKKPHHHQCSICNKTFQSELLDGVWVYYYRNQVALNTWKSAVLYEMTKKKKYLKYIKSMIHFYGKKYLEFPLHNKEGHIYKDIQSAEWGCGRIMPQGLNESIWIIRMINGFEIVKKYLESEDLMTILELSRHIFDVLKPQVNKVHNISCWKNSAILNMGLFNRDEEMMDFAHHGTYGLEVQLTQGVTKDFFWYEGSIHYNFFTLEGIINSLLFAKVYQYHIPQRLKKIVMQMLEQAYEYAFSNHILPNPNDGWPNINLKTYGYIYDMATKVFGERSMIAEMNKNIINGTVDRVELPLSRPYYYKEISLERLILIPTLDTLHYRKVIADAHNFKTSQFAILRHKDINVFYKYGHNGPSHAHPDKMSIEVMMNQQMLSRDLSNAGYGVALSNEWHRVTASHNTVVVNGGNQISMRHGKTINYRSDYLKAEAKDIYRDLNINLDHMTKTMNPDEIIKYLTRYLSFSKEQAKEAILHSKDLSEFIQKRVTELPKVDYLRTVKITEDGFNDYFQVTSDRDVTMDYFFHLDAKLNTRLSLKNADLGYKSFGYQHLKNIKLVRTRNKKVAIEWLLGDMIVESVIHLNEGAKLYLMKSLDNPITQFRDTFVIRKIGNEANFKVEWQVKEKTE